MAEAPPTHSEELLDVLTKSGEKTGVAKPRGLVHRDGDFHRAAHVWIYAETTQELLLQRRVDCGRWDISSAGHVTAGDTSLATARRELDEELGISLPEEAFELIFLFRQELVLNDGKYINNEHDDVYLVTTLDPIPLEAFTLQETEVSSVRYMPWQEFKSCLASEDKEYIPCDVNGQYGQLFRTIEQRSALDEGKAFLTTVDSPVKLVESTKPIFGWKGIKYRVAFPLVQPPGASFYPPDMDQQVPVDIIPTFEVVKEILEDIV